MDVSEISLCAALASHRIQPLTTVTRAGRIIWQYPDDDHARKICEDYLAGTLSGNLLVFNNYLRVFQAQLKGVAHASR